MEINVINEKENPLFSRKEIHLQVSTEVVPSKDEARKIVADKYSSSKDLIRIREVKGKFGVSIFDIVADIYSSKEEFNRIVKKTKQEVDVEKKLIEEAKAAKAEAASKEDVPSEEGKKAEEEAKATAEAEKVGESVPVASKKDLPQPIRPEREGASPSEESKEAPVEEVKEETKEEAKE